MADFIKDIGLDWVNIAYICAMAGLAVLVHYLARRSINRDSNATLSLLDWFEMRGLGIFFHIAVIAGTCAFFIFGWRVPAEYSALFFESSADLTNLLPRLEPNILSRSAQVIGGLSMAYIALRSMRYIVPVMVTICTIVVILLAIQYILDTNMTELL